MPELPEVETVVRDLRSAGLVGRTIQDIVVRWPRTLATPSAEEARARLKGASVTGVGRRGKYILLELSTGESLIVHLRMTGQLDLQASEQPLDPHHHMIVVLNGPDDLRFRDTRKFGRFYLVADALEIVGKLGPEPIDTDFSFAELEARLKGRKRQIKPLLLDQGFVAGLGNIYVDEALFRAHVHPERLANSLSLNEQQALYQAMRDVLNEGIGNSGTSLGDGSTNYTSVAGKPGQNKGNLRVFRRTGQPCITCGTVVERLIVGQRSSHICPTCQPINGLSL